MEKSEFNILSELARGGQKVVYLAEGKQDANMKAVIKEAPINSISSFYRISREISLLSGLDSVYFPHNFGSNLDLVNGRITIIEEYIEGSTLRNVMGNYNSWETILPLFKELINALSIVWDKNIVHRDLKPENILIRPNGKPVIIDFGIARFLDMESITNTLQQMGPCTPLYASPEQMINAKHIIDQRTDFYSLGIILLELYLGVHPFSPDAVGNGIPLIDNLNRGTFAVATQNVKEDKRISLICRKLLQPQAYNRFRNYKQLVSFINTL